MLDKQLREEIQQAYSRLVERAGLSPRYGQRLMIAEVAKTLGAIKLADNGERAGPAQICVVEAGTGTGKTLAYAVAALPVARALGKKLVVASATVTLQEQIVLRDFPALRVASGLEFDFVLAKGRRRYVCLSKLDQLLSAPQEQELALSLYGDEPGRLLTADAIAGYRAMLSALVDGSWQGDRDSWAETIADYIWYPVTTDHAQCAGRRCPHVSQCSYFRARENLDSAECVVTNHDMVLADLALGGGAILPAPEQSIYVFDEGHHLPDKAVSHFTRRQRLGSSMAWLEQVVSAAAALARVVGEDSEFAPLVGVIAPSVEELQRLLAEVRTLLQPLVEADGKPVDARDNALRYRFSQGDVPAAIQHPAAELVVAFEGLARQVERLLVPVEDVLSGRSSSSLSRDDAELWYPALGGILARARANAELWSGYRRSDPGDQPPHARWLTLYGDGAADLEVAVTPVNGAGLLQEMLWSRCCGAVITSATLTALGSFQRFVDRSGVPDESRFLVVPSPFDYTSAAELQVLDLGADPADNKAHGSAVAAALPALVTPSVGNLVIFASRRQMLAVYDELLPELRQQVLLQDHYSKQELLRLHRERVDAGRGSIIFGLASFAEGVDLPGTYCSHVIIAKIPFAVPDDPVEATVSDWVKSRGGNPFMDIAVPDAAVKLVQASGRLLRREEDTGTITLLDSRLLSRRYGRAILDSLPPYRRRSGRRPP